MGVNNVLEAMKWRDKVALWQPGEPPRATEEAQRSCFAPVSLTEAPLSQGPVV